MGRGARERRDQAQQVGKYWDPKVGRKASLGVSKVLELNKVDVSQFHVSKS